MTNLPIPIERHRSPTDLLSWLVVIASVGLLLSPLVSGIAMCAGWGR